MLELPPNRTLIMGILNVTPDSFSDGGRFLEYDRAVEHALDMIREGADIIDVGGESTRPSSRSVSAEEELQRVIPVIERLAGRTDVPISVDTYKSRVAEAALEAGASIINDISALRFDPDMCRVAASWDAPLVLMHMQGTPQTMQLNPHYDDVVAEIRFFFGERLEFAADRGIRLENIILDPGIGFGKTVEHNLEILRRFREFESLGRPLLLGTSRKSFIGKILDRGPLEREVGSNATVAIGIYNGARIVRVHDVRSAKETAMMVDAIKSGLNGPCANC